MSADSTYARSRRAVLGAAVGAGLASIAAALGRPRSADAANGTAIVLGVQASGDGLANSATAQTKVISTAAGLEVDSGASTIAVKGFAGPGGVGLWGQSTALGEGVAGIAENGDGVHGESNTNGVFGLSHATSGSVAGVAGQVDALTGQVAGVWGQAKSPTGIGVYGETTDTGSAENYGVAGVSRSSLGRAMFGWSQSTAGGSGVWGQTNAASGSGVLGYAWDGDAATGAFGTGVMGTSGSHAFPPPPPLPNTGVYGIATKNATSRGVVGKSSTGTGVVGSSGSGAAPAAKAHTGVYGRAEIDAASVGVRGDSALGTGVMGLANGTPAPATSANVGVYGRADGIAASIGVVGQSDNGTGVSATSAGGTAVAATATHASAFAIVSSGRLQLKKASGVATIAANTTSIVVALGIDVNVNSFAFLTPKADPGTRRLWCTIDGTANSLTIHTNAAAATSLAVAWLVLG